MNESAVLHAIEMLQNGMCQEHGHVDQCVAAVEAILPIALETIQSDRNNKLLYIFDTTLTNKGFFAKFYTHLNDFYCIFWNFKRLLKHILTIKKCFKIFLIVLFVLIY